MNTFNPSPIELNTEISVPTAAKVEKSKKIMSAMIASGQLTPEGEAWLKVNSDPWHDTKITGFRGVPDNYQGQSVTMSINQELSISKIPSLGAGNWAVRISTNPVASQVQTDSYVKQGNVVDKGSVEPMDQVYQWPVQVDYALGDQPFTPWVDLNTTGLEIPSGFLKGPYRVCGMGIEVINTTAPLQKQGLATCAVMNQSSTKNFTLKVYGATTAPPTGFPDTSASFFPVKSPPTTLADMLLLPGTTQWEAAEGAYSVVQLLELDNTPPGAVPEYPLYIDEDFDAINVIPDGTGLVPTTTCRVPHLQTGFFAGGNGLVPKPYMPRIPGHVPMNTTIQMYSGLSDQTTLTLRVRWILERFPNDNEPEIVVLTSPTAPWDPVAIEIQSRLMAKLVPAVMFKENPKGEWWKTMLAGIADIAGSGLMMLPHPLAKGAGAALMAGRAYLAPDIPVKYKATKTKNRVVPAKRPQNAPGIKYISSEELKKKKKKAKKKRVAAAAA
jgi:hypothetical protein